MVRALAIAIDNNVTVPAGVALTSLLTNAAEHSKYEVFILYIDLSELNREKLKKMESVFSNITINFIDCRDYVQTGFEIRGITATCYLRLLIPRLLSEYNKVLYLDVDTIILGDLKELYERNMGDYALCGMRMKPLPETYINSGVLLFNNSAFSDKEIDRSLSMIGESLVNQDQDIINKVYKEKIDSTLNPKYNFGQSTARRLAHGDYKSLTRRNNRELVDDFASDYRIIHYTGRKPWKQLVEWGDYWWEYFRKSPFFDRDEYIKAQAWYSDVPSWKQLVIWLAKKLQRRSY